jgi:hypothetical protein
MAGRIPYVLVEGLFGYEMITRTTCCHQSDVFAGLTIYFAIPYYSLSASPGCLSSAAKE